MVNRYFDPRETARAGPAKVIAEQHAKRTAMMIAGQKPERALTASLNSAEKELEKALKVTRRRKCFRCGSAINLASTPHYRMTVATLVRFFPGEDPLWQSLSPNLYGRFEQGHSGVVAMLNPPDTGELGLCLDCAQHACDYLNEQLPPGQSAEHGLHTKSLAELFPPAEQATTPSARRRKAPSKPARGRRR